MNPHNASLLCDRCGRSPTDRPDGGFRFCPGCTLYVCARCWSTLKGQCQSCARPDLAPEDLPTSRSIRDTIAPPPLGNVPVSDPLQWRRTRSLARPQPERAPAGNVHRSPAAQVDRATTIVLLVVRRVLMAASLAVAGMAVGWAVDLSMNPAAPSDAPRTLEGTLSGTPEQRATFAPSPTESAVSHTVARGETLIGLADRYYGDESRWREILRANEDRIADPDNLRIGTVLLIPPP